MFLQRLLPVAFALLVWVAISTITEGVLQTEGTWNFHPEYQHAFGHLNAVEAIPILARSSGLLSAVLTWVAFTTRHPRLRFEIPFWGGVLLLLAACRCSWRASVIGRTGAEGSAFDHVGVMESMPMLCTFTMITGLFFILWAIHRN